jgi:hypothetical protein
MKLMPRENQVHFILYEEKHDLRNHGHTLSSGIKCNVIYVGRGLFDPHGG